MAEADNFDKEYGAYIYMDDYGYYYNSISQASITDTHIYPDITLIPPGYTVVAYLHTHKQHNSLGNIFNALETQQPDPFENYVIDICKHKYYLPPLARYYETQEWDKKGA